MKAIRWRGLSHTAMQLSSRLRKKAGVEVTLVRYVIGWGVRVQSRVRLGFDGCSFWLGAAAPLLSGGRQKATLWEVGYAKRGS